MGNGINANRSNKLHMHYRHFLELPFGCSILMNNIIWGSITYATLQLDFSIMSDSDSSVDIEVQPLGKFNAETYMKNLGYIDGQGLGAENQGIVAPIEVTPRTKNTGIGYDINLSDATNAEGELPSAKSRFVYIKQELVSLKSLKSSLETEIDIPAFYGMYYSFDFWHDLQLWKAVKYQLTCNLRKCNCFSSQIALDLEVAQLCMPRSDYIHLLNAEWLSKALQMNTHDLIAFVIPNHLIVEPVLSLLAQNLIPKLVGSSLLADALPLPQFRNALADLISEMPINASNLHPILVYLDVTKNYAILSFSISSFEKLMDETDLFKTTPHYDEILRTRVLPIWVHSLIPTLNSNDLDTLTEQLVALRSRVPEDEPIFIEGLHLINAYFDIQKVRASTHTPKFDDVIDAFCGIRGYVHTSSGNESGRVFGPNTRPLSYYVSEDELCWNLHGGLAGEPLRIQDIDKILAQPLMQVPPRESN